MIRDYSTISPKGFRQLSFGKKIFFAVGTRSEDAIYYNKDLVINNKKMFVSLELIFY